MIKKLIFVLTFFLISLSLFTTISFAKDNNRVRVVVGTTATEGFPFYCQYGDVNKDGELSKYRYWNYRKPTGGYCDIYRAGCTMAALAMIQTYFGDKTTPTQASKENRFVGCISGVGTKNSDINGFIRPKLIRQGYIVTPDFTDRSYNSTGGYTGKANLRLLKSFLDRGYIIWAGGKVRYGTHFGWSNPGGHAFVITEVDVQNQTATGYDPTFCIENIKSLSGGKRVFRNVNSLGGDFGCAVKDGIRSCGWSMLYAMKKR